MSMLVYPVWKILAFAMLFYFTLLSVFIIFAVYKLGQAKKQWQEQQQQKKDNNNNGE